MSLGQIKAGSAFVEITAKDSTQSGTRSALSSLKSFAGGLSSSAAMISSTIAAISSSAIIGGLTAAVKSFADVGSELSDMSARTGLAAGQLQSLGFAAKQSGSSLADIELAIRHMQKHGQSASNFEAIGRKIASITDPSARASAAMEAFGKSGTRLLPMFAELTNLKSASAALGPVFTSEEAARADKLGDSFGALQEAVTRAASQIGDALSPALQDSLEIAIGITAEFGKWVHSLKMVGEVANVGFKSLAKDLPIFGKFLSKGLRGLESAGERGVAGSGSKRDAALAGLEDEEVVADDLKKQMDGLKEAFEKIGKGVDKAKEQIDQFKTPAEQFADKIREMEQSINMVNRARVTGMIHDQEASRLTDGLKTAMSRAIAEENSKNQKARDEPIRQIIGNFVTPLEKLRQQFGIIHAALRQEPDPGRRRDLTATLGRIRTAMADEASKFTTQGSRGTFSARGAGLIGVGSRILVEEKNGAKVVQNLHDIKIEIGKIVPVFK